MVSLSNAPQIPGLTYVKVLGQGAFSTVYEALHQGSSFAVKILDPQYLFRSDQLEASYKREAAALAQVNHRHLVKLEECGEYQGIPYLIMELVHGEILASTLKKSLFSEDKALTLAREMAEAMHVVHSKSLIHGDIKPSNIMLQSTGEAKIIDFGLAMRMNKATKNLTSELTWGSFLYSSPEQLGLLQVPVDARSDLYSLGLVLYEILTGITVFKTSTVEEFFQKQRTYQPTLAHEVNQAVRPVVGMIIAKLTAKDPSERYQSAYGLLEDLKNCDALNARLLSGAGITLDQPQVDLGIDSQVTLVGRQTQLDELLRQWTLTRNMQGHMVQIEGEAGSGKTRLIREFVKRVLADDVLYLTGKSNPNEKIPFASLRSALEKYLDHVRLQGEPVRQESIERIRRAAEDGGSLLNSFSKKFDFIFPQTVQTSLLEDVFEGERFYNKIINFIINLAKQYGAALLFFDDIQWIDEPTTEILKRIAEKSQRESLPVFIITASRDDPQSNALKEAFLQTIGQRHIRILTVPPLTFAEVCDLVTQHLGGKPPGPQLVEKILILSKGNPFAIGEYIHALLDGGYLQAAIGGWTWAVSQLAAVDLPGDVITLLINRINTLNDEHAKILMAAALIGFEFEARFLEQGLGIDERKVLSALTSGVHKNILEKESSSYRFVHDRVREALVKRLDSDQSRYYHQKLAEGLDALEHKSPQQVYAVAKFYAHGYRDEEKNKRKVYESHYQAGVLALKNYASDEAYYYLSHALQVGLELQDSPNLNNVREALAQTANRLGKQAQAHELYQAVYAATNDDDSKIRLEYQIAMVYCSEGKNEEAWENLQNSLRRLGAGFPKSGIMQVLTLVWYWVLTWLVMKKVVGPKKLSEKEMARRKVISTIHKTANLVAYFLGNPALLAQVNFRERYNASLQGPSAEMVRAQTFYAFLLSFVFTNVASIRRHREKALALAEKVGDLEALSYARFYCAVATEMTGELVVGAQYCQKDLADSEKYLTSWDRTCMYGHISETMFMQGHSRDLIQWGERIIPLCQEKENALAVVVAACFHYVHLFLTGDRVSSQNAFAVMDTEMQKIPNVKMAHIYYLGSQIQVMAEQRDFSEEFDKKITECLKYKDLDYHTRIFFIIIAHARLEQFIASQRQKGKDQQRGLRVIKRALRQAKAPALMTRQPIFAMHFLIIGAFLAQAEGRYAQAGLLLDQAEKMATQVESPWGGWLVARERARLALAQGLNDLGQVFGSLAYHLAKENGWAGRAQQIRDQFPSLKLDSSSAPHLFAKDFSHVMMADIKSIEGKRILEALLRISLSCVRVSDPDLLAKMALDETIKVLGAERGIFIRIDPTTQQLMAALGRDYQANDLDEAACHQAFSTTLLDKVKLGRQAIVVSDLDDKMILSSQSVMRQRLKSLMAAPVMVGEKMFGVLYVDSRLAKGLFSAADLGIFQAMANHLALGMEGARMAQIELQNKLLQKDLENRLHIEKMEKKLALIEQQKAHAAGMAEVGSRAIHSIGNAHAVSLLSLQLLKDDVASTSLINPDLQSDLLTKLDSLEKSAKLVADLVHDQQKYAKSGFFAQKHDLAELVDEVASLRRDQIKVRGISITKEFAQVPPVLIQKTKVIAIVDNLLKNAEEALRDMPPAERKILLRVVRGEDGTAQIQVRDTGVGITDEVRANLFQMGYTTRKDGHGFGLNMCMNAMHEMGGNIAVESAGQGQGASFTVSFPLELARDDILVN